MHAYFRLFLWLVFGVSPLISLAGVSPGVVFNLPFNGDTNSYINGSGGLSIPPGGGGGGSTNWLDVTTNSYTLGNIGIGTLPITAQKMTLRVDNLTTSPINGLFLTNATSATAGVTVQDSPAIYQSGGAWLTGSLSNAPVTFRHYVVPAVGSAGPSTTGSKWMLEGSSNGGAFGNTLMYSLNGALTVPLDIISTGADIQAVAAGFFKFGTSRSLVSSSANGAVELANSSITARATLQANIPQVTKTANYTITVLDSGLRFVNIGAVATNRLDLPTAAAGMHFWFYIDAAQNCRVQATGSDVVREGATVSGAGGGIESLTVGSTLHLFSPKALLWVIDQKNGTWVGPNGP